MTAFTGSVADLTTGTAPTSTQLGYITDALQGLSDAWSSYTPTWAASGTAVSLGNGTQTGKYLQVGKFVVAKFNITMGSSTTYGTGTYTVAAPVAPNSDAFIHGVMWAFDNSTTTTYVGAVQTGTANFAFRCHGGTAQVGQTVPFTWAQSDHIRGLAVYEVS